MSRYKSPISELLTKNQTSIYYEKIARTLYQVQLRLHVIPQPVPAIPKTQVSVEAWEHHEQQLNHEVAAWVAAWREYLPREVRPYTYMGLTSSNMIDTARALEAQTISATLNRQVSTLVTEIDLKTHRFRDHYREGRTHGQLAYPVPMTLVYDRACRDLYDMMDRVHQSLPMGALSGPTGNPHPVVLSAAVRHQTAAELGVSIDDLASQVASRVHFQAWCQAVYNLLAVCEQLATYHRLESIAGIDRFREGFRQGVQKGSSSMPHKRNPARSERICGLARVARGHLHALSESATTLWWERDLSNSSTERLSYYGLVEIVSFALQEMIDIIRDSEITPPLSIPEVARTSDRLINAQLRGEDPDEAYYRIQSAHLGEGGDDA